MLLILVLCEFDAEGLVEGSEDLLQRDIGDRDFTRRLLIVRLNGLPQCHDRFNGELIFSGSFVGIDRFGIVHQVFDLLLLGSQALLQELFVFLEQLYVPEELVILGLLSRGLAEKFVDLELLPLHRVLQLLDRLIKVEHLLGIGQLGLSLIKNNLHCLHVTLVGRLEL